MASAQDNGQTSHGGRDAFEARLAELERLLAAQQEEIAAQRSQLSAQSAEIGCLRAEQVERAAAPASPLILPAKFRGRGAAHDAAPERAQGRHTSRRGLLKLGGAAAAAGAAVAAGALTGHAPIAHAAAEGDGNYLQLGVNYQNFAATTTYLEPSPLSSPDVLLTVDNSGSLTQDIFGCGVKAYGPHNYTGACGVQGIANGATGKGVWGQSDKGIGVLAQSGGYYDLWLGGTGRLYQGPAQAPGFPTTGTHFPGEQIRDSNADMWICVGFGGPYGTGKWVQVAAPQYGYAGGALNLLPIPIRLLDTRAGASDANLHPGAPVAYHGTINVPAAGVTYQSQTIPTGAVAVFGLLTAALAPGVNCGDGSSAIAYAAGATRPGAVSVLFNPQDLQGAYTANFALVQTGVSGDISIYSQPINPVAVDYLFDCFGFVM
jgi:hypothetical protein